MAAPPEALRGNPTGAGDAASAALAVGIAEGSDWPHRLADAVALSAAAVAAPLAGSFDAELYRRLLGQVEVRELGAGATQVAVEEGEDPPPRVLGGRVVVVEADELHQRREQRPGVDAVQEAVAGVRVFLDVVGDVEGGERLFQPCRCGLFRVLSRLP